MSSSIDDKRPGQQLGDPASLSVYPLQLINELLFILTCITLVADIGTLMITGTNANDKHVSSSSMMSISPVKSDCGLST